MLLPVNTFLLILLVQTGYMVLLFSNKQENSSLSGLGINYYYSVSMKQQNNSMERYEVVREGWESNKIVSRRLDASLGLATNSFVHWACFRLGFVMCRWRVSWGPLPPAVKCSASAQAGWELTRRLRVSNVCDWEGKVESNSAD